MIKLVVSERGRKKNILSFSKEEISIGRTEGNDVVLARPQVSKRHARLFLKDGELFIEDLNSTNGTYLNGRRISQVEKVTPGDRIFIGDFVIKALVEEEKEASPEELPPVPKDEVPEESEEVLLVEEELEELEDLEEEPEIPIEESSPEKLPEAQPEEEAPEIEVVKTYPGTAEVTQRTAYQEGPETEEALKEYGKYLDKVAQKVEAVVFKNEDLSGKELTDEEWSYYSDRLLQVVESMRRAEEIPRDVDTFNLSQDVLAEYVGLGPLDFLLSDDTVRTIQVVGPTKIFALRGYRWERVPKVFSSVGALTRVMSRLVREAKIKDITARHFLRGRLPDGTILQILLPPLTVDHTIILKKARPPSLTIQDLINAKVLDRSHLDLIQEVIQTGGNILICGPKGAGKTVLLNALVGLLPRDSRLVVITGRNEISPPHLNTVTINKENLGLQPDSAPTIIEGLDPDWVVLSDVESGDTKTLVELATNGRYFFLGTVTGPDCPGCIQRLSMRIALSYPELTPGDRERIIYSNIRLLVGVKRIQGVGSRVVSISRLSMENGTPVRTPLLEKG